MENRSSSASNADPTRRMRPNFVNPTNTRFSHFNTGYRPPRPTNMNFSQSTQPYSAMGFATLPPHPFNIPAQPGFIRSQVPPITPDNFQYLASLQNLTLGMPPTAIHPALITNPMTTMFATTSPLVNPFIQTTAPLNNPYPSRHPIVHYTPGQQPTTRTPPVQRAVQRLKIINPETMKEVDLMAVARSRRESVDSRRNSPIPKPVEDIANNDFLASLAAEPDVEDDLEPNPIEIATTEWYPASFTADQEGIFEVASEAEERNGDLVIMNSAVPDEVDENEPVPPIEDAPSQYSRDFILKCYKNEETRSKPSFLFEGSVAILATISGNLTDVLLRSRESIGGRRTASSRLQKTQPRAYNSNRRGSHRFYPAAPEVQLHRTSNPYKVLDQSELTPGQQMEKRFRELLNKISPENERTVQADIINLEFKSPDDIAGPLEIIFDKAVYEPQYRSIYARIAHYLCSRVSFKVIEQPTEEGGEAKVTLHKFKSALMKKVENAFRANFTEEPDLLEWLEKRDKAQSEAEYNHLQSCYNEAYSMKKRKFLGLMEFIGHLYLIGVLNEKIIKNCVDRLMSVQTGETAICEWQIESMIKLSLVIGKAFDENGNGNLLTTFMRSINECMSQLEDSRRVRWMFEDLRQKRSAKWVDSDFQAANHSRSARPKGSELQFDKKLDGFGRAKQDPSTVFKHKISQIDSVADKTIREYIRSRDMDAGERELVTFVGKSLTPDHQLKLWAAIVSKGYDIVCDKAEADVVSWTKLLRKLVDDDKMDKNAFIAGLHEFWIIAQENVVDVPLLYQLMGAGLAPLIEFNIDLDQVLQPIADPERRVEIVGKLFKNANMPCMNLVKKLLKKEELAEKCRRMYGLH